MPPEHRGRPRYFVSHTWSRTLHDLLDMLQDQFRGAGEGGGHDVLLWLDIFAINQVRACLQGACLQGA